MNPSSSTAPTRQHCLGDLVREQAARNPEGISIVAPGRTALSYRDLSRQIDEVVETLGSLGISRNDRVAMVLPDGPEMAVAVIAIASGAACAPLNPASRAAEFEFHLRRLDARALLVLEDSTTPAIGVARARGIPVLQLTPAADSGAGRFTLSGEHRLHQNPRGIARPEDAALVLYTSGTSARPRLVTLTHKNLCASAHNICAALELTESDRCLGVMPLFHIHGLSALFASLAAGASIVCTSGFSGAHFFEWLEELQPTWYTAAPTIHQAIVQNASLNGEITAPVGLRFIRSASSAMPARVTADLERIFRAPVIEAYGMTEAAPQIASQRLPPHERKPGSVGRAAGPEIAIMDAAGNLVPSGQTGEIVVRGANVIRAYESDPEADRLAFTRGWFRTGDSGHVDSDGDLFITGRLKEIINRGGEKISPPEVDDVLLAHHAVAEAATFAFPHSTLGEAVAAAIVLRPGTSLTEAEIRQFVGSRLAEFKVPQHIFIVDEIPKGATGKMERAGLAERLGLVGADEETPGGRSDVTAPRTPEERKLAEVLAAVLGRERVGIHDSFFQLGGNSLSATQVIARIKQDFQVELPIGSIFEKSTVAELARLITDHQFPQSGGAIDRRAAIIPRSGTAGVFPLSFAQQRLWFLDRLEPGNPAYNMRVALRVSGTLEMAALERSLSEILRRHEALRATFSDVDGQPVQTISPAKALRLPVVDFSMLADADKDGEVQRLAAEEGVAPFVLARGPLLRAMVLRLSADEHVLLLTMHHIVSDGWSMGVFYDELGALYKAFSAGQTPHLPALPCQYTDYAMWQRERLSPAVLENLLAYWRNVLADCPPAVAWLTDRRRPSVQTYRGSRLHTTISSQLTDGLKALSLDEGATLFMVMLAAFQTLLSRYADRDDLPVGIPIAHRTQPETEGLIGLFANTLVMRTNLSGDPTFREALNRVRASALGAYAHQDLPFDRLVEELRPRRDPSHMPLFQVTLAFQNVPAQRLELASGQIASELHVDSGVTKVDLTLYLAETEHGLAATWQYDRELFDAPTIERMAEHFRTLLEAIVRDPDRPLSEMPLLNEVERHRLLVEWNQTEMVAFPARCVHQLFEEQAQRTPDAVAIEQEGDRYTYRELNSRANHLARRLQRLGVRRGSMVGVCLTRSPWMAVALLAVLKAGGTYVPLDPAYPADRLAFMVKDTGLLVLLTEDRPRHQLPPCDAVIVHLDTHRNAIAAEDSQNLQSIVAPADLAYVIYTSGSTGTPKGVMVTHANLCHYVRAIRDALGITADDRWLHTASFALSPSVRQFLVPLSCGAAVVVATTDQILDPRELFELVRRDQVTTIDIVPSYWRACNQTLARLDPLSRLALLDNKLRMILSASEPLPPDLPKEWASAFRHGAQLINMFGHTETSGISTIHRISAEEAAGAKVPPIGRPIGNTRVYVLDKSQRPVPIGVAGEMFIAGDGIGLGYLDRPELTAERFVPDPFSSTPGARLYRTGDRARYTSDGTLHFCGRSDDEIKVRGFRIDPGEIEAVLGQHPAVHECAVVSAAGFSGARKLTAYIVEGAPLARARTPGRLATELRQFLRQKLPDYMVPNAIVSLETLPRTPSGKVDRKALCSRSDGPEDVTVLHHAQAPDIDHAVAPLSTAEKTLSKIWAEVLHLDHVGVDDNFFELGGDSILSIQIINRANAAGLGLRLIDLFQHQTIAELARVAVAELVSDAVKPAVRITVESMRAYGREALERAGLTPEGAAIVTEVQLESSLRGQPTHNMGAIPRYARRLASGAMNPTPRLSIERETAISAVIDGDNGPGQWVGVMAMELAISKARQEGIGVVGARRSNHFGAAGHYAWLAARENLIGLCTTNGAAWLAPIGGLTPTLGNNPLGVGIAAGRHHPIVLDISMSVTAKGKIALHLAEGKPIPAGWILNRFGLPSTDPADLAAGLGVAIGGHKGYGLAFVMEVLAGVLTGAGFCLDHDREHMRQSMEPPDIGHFFIAINPELFMPVAEFVSRVDSLIDQTKSARRADDIEELIVPGEPEMRARALNLEAGVPLDHATYRALEKYRKAAGLKAELVVAG